MKYISAEKALIPLSLANNTKVCFIQGKYHIIKQLPKSIKCFFLETRDKETHMYVCNIIRYGMVSNNKDMSDMFKRSQKCQIWNS